MGTVLLLRHGETTWNRDGRVQGWAASPLTELGREQARALGDRLACEYDVDRLLSSDLRRAVETTRYTRRSTGLTPTFESAWRERGFGQFQGMTQTELFEDHPQYALAKVGYRAATERPDRGERLLDMRERVLGRWRELCDGLRPDETVAVVAHGGPIYVVLGDVKGYDIVASITDQEQGNCAVNELRVDDGDVTIAREDDTSHLDTETKSGSPAD